MPFKFALIYYTLKYLGFDLSYIDNILNNINLGIIDWLYDKITNLFEQFNSNDNNN